MAATLEKKDKNEVELTIDIEPQVFNEALEYSFKKNSKHFMIPGFRKGKAPMGLVTKYYGEGVLYEDAVNYAIDPAYTAAVKEHDLDPVSQPDINILEIGKEKGLKFTALVTIKPEVTLGQYEGVEAVKPDRKIDDEAVDAEIGRVQKRNGRLIPVEDRPVEDGDTVNIDYSGSVDGEIFEGGTAEAFDLAVGSNTFIPGFEEQLIGHEIEESFSITVTFPEEYGNEDLAGREAVFEITINGIKVEELPELDDEFAKDISEFDTFAAYKEDLAQKMQAETEKANDNIFRENVINAIVKNADVDIPAVMIENEINSMVDEQNHQMQHQGFSLEDYLGYLGQSIADYKDQLRDTAENRVRTSLVLSAVTSELDLPVSDEEIEAEIEETAKSMNMEPEKLKETVLGSDSQIMHESVSRKKTLEWLVEKAVAVAHAPAEESEEDQAQEDAAIEKED